MRRTTAFALLLWCGLQASAAWAFVWPNVPDEIARALSDDDAGERRGAAARLRELPAALAAPLVWRALGDTDVEVRLIASRAAVEMRVAGVGERVIAWLGEGDPRLRLAACEVIRLSPTSNAITPLTRALGDANADVRVGAAMTLGVLGSREAVPALLGHLDDPSPEARGAVVQALGRIGDARAVVPLLGKVQDAAADVRRIAVRVLGELGDARVSSALMLALRDKTVAVQIEAAESLGRLKAAEAVSALAPMALDRSLPRVRDAAVIALGRLGTSSALDALMGALAGDDPGSERSATREALVSMGKLAELRLVEVLEGGGAQDVAASACLVLAESGDKRQTRRIVDALQRGRVTARIGLRALARLGDPDALPSVLELLESPVASVRRAAMEAASQLLEPSEPVGSAVDPLVAQIASSQTTVEDRMALVELLGQTGSARAAPTLVGLSGSKDGRVRAAAIAALGNIGRAGQDQVLLEALGDQDPTVRSRAASALAQVAGADTARELLRRVGIASEQDRTAIGTALVGAMSRSRDDDVASRAAAMLGTVRESLRDVLVEGLGRMPVASAGNYVASLADSSLSVDDRRKTAEALAGHPNLVGFLRKLSVDPDPSVQANAVWSLGTTGGVDDIPVLVELAKHRDVAVAGNAVASIGRISSRQKMENTKTLCSMVDESRTYVRANAVAALALLRARCSDGAPERRMLLSDPSAVVRARVARLVRQVPSTDPVADGRALGRCLFDDRSGQVANECNERLAPRPSHGPAHEPVLVIVVPEGRSAPRPRSAFALVFADGLMRMGITDRRGAVFEARAPRGEVFLAVPATLVR